jgi:hypothetical protein
MSVIMALFMSLVISMINVGFGEQLIAAWLEGWLIGFLVSFPLSLVVPSLLQWMIKKFHI